VDLFEIVAGLLSLAALFSFLNYHLFRLPNTIGLMLFSLLLSLAIIFVGHFNPAFEAHVVEMVEQVDFDQTVMHGMLGFLLFAGALHINLSDLSRHWMLIGLLISIGVVLSTLLVAVMAWGVCLMLGIEMRFIYCLLFGALISPTDPIAVLGLLRQMGAPHDLGVKIAGESLFNDGVGVVIFLGLLEAATSSHGFDLNHLGILFLQEAVGGAMFGLALGALGFWMLRGIENYQVEILLSLALAAGGYALALRWHLSGPIAMVVAGLLIGNQGRRYAMSPSTVEHLDLFWELVDEILNAVLFVLIGLEILIFAFQGAMIWAGVLMIPVTLLCRAIAVSIPVTLVAESRESGWGLIKILTWGGLRGGISIALALSLPRVVGGETVPERDSLIAITYIIVLFSILVQGLTIKHVVRRTLPATE
jgi:monovalent cation:H+ antiporter, CPA1 family